MDPIRKPFSVNYSPAIQRPAHRLRDDRAGDGRRTRLGCSTISTRFLSAGRGRPSLGLATLFAWLVCSRILGTDGVPSAEPALIMSETGLATRAALPCGSRDAVQGVAFDFGGTNDPRAWAGLRFAQLPARDENSVAARWSLDLCRLSSRPLTLRFEVRDRGGHVRYCRRTITAVTWVTCELQIPDEFLQGDLEFTWTELERFAVLVEREPSEEGRNPVRGAFLWQAGGRAADRPQLPEDRPPPAGVTDKAAHSGILPPLASPPEAVDRPVPRPVTPFVRPAVEAAQAPVRRAVAPVAGRLFVAAVGGLLVWGSWLLSAAHVGPQLRRWLARQRPGLRSALLCFCGLLTIPLVADRLDFPGGVVVGGRPYFLTSAPLALVLANTLILLIVVWGDTQLRRRPGATREAFGGNGHVVLWIWGLAALVVAGYFLHPFPRPAGEAQARLVLARTAVVGLQGLRYVLCPYSGMAGLVFAAGVAVVWAGARNGSGWSMLRGLLGLVLAAIVVGRVAAGNRPLLGVTDKPPRTELPLGVADVKADDNARVLRYAQAARDAAWLEAAVRDAARYGHVDLLVASAQLAADIAAGDCFEALLTCLAKPEFASRLSFSQWQEILASAAALDARQVGGRNLEQAHRVSLLAGPRPFHAALSATSGRLATARGQDPLAAACRREALTRAAAESPAWADAELQVVALSCLADGVVGNPNPRACLAELQTALRTWGASPHPPNQIIALAAGAKAAAAVHRWDLVIECLRGVLRGAPGQFRWTATPAERTVTRWLLASLCAVPDKALVRAELLAISHVAQAEPLPLGERAAVLLFLAQFSHRAGAADLREACLAQAFQAFSVEEDPARRQDCLALLEQACRQEDLHLITAARNAAGAANLWFSQDRDITWHRLDRVASNLPPPAGVTRAPGN